MSKTLHLPLKAKWYEMIESGVKTEEYRILSHYWVQRLLVRCNGKRLKRDEALKYAFREDMLKFPTVNEALKFKKYETVKLSYGYTHRTMIFEIESITIGKGNPEWGAPNKEVFVIKLGRRVA